jgi:glucose/arabinose dehydrogenase
MRRTLAAWCVAFGGLAPGWLAPAGAAGPAGFSDSLVASVATPTAIDFTPDGRALVASKGGTLHVIQNDSLVGTPAITFPAASICTESERGLLGVAVHPSFGSNQLIYLFYTFKTGGTPPCVNRVSRFTLPPSNVINPASEVILIDNMPSPNGNHNAGDVQFGKDGFLYVSIGEGGVSSAARNENVLTGKILRVTDTGGIPASNPFQGAGTAVCAVTGSTTPGNKCQETFAWGFRNPFRIAFDPNDPGTRFFINDVGQSRWEEIDLAQSGADYGWNICEGSHDVNLDTPCSAPPPGMVSPVFEYRHDLTVPGTTSTANCNSITAGAFVPNGVWAGFDNTYLFADFVCGWIFRLPSSGAAPAADFATSLGNFTLSHLRFGPNGFGGPALWYATLGGGGQVRRITGPSPPGPAEDFHTLDPCRLVDTRQAPGPLGGPPLAGGETRTFALVGLCGVPSGATALAVNLTVIGPTGAGFLTGFAAGTGQPTTSTINFSAGQTRANNAVFPLSPNGTLAVFAGLAGGATVHMALDVTGYFQ